MQLISVIMPVYNNQEYLREAIDSVLKMDYPEIELLIVDDGSTDRSTDIINEYVMLDSRIKPFKHLHNKGTNKAIKTAIRNSNGKYIFFAAADDISLPDRIEKCLDVFASDNTIGIIASNAIIIDSNGYETGEVYNIDNYITNDNIAINQFKRNYCLGAAMAIVNDKDILLRDDMLQFTDDYEIALEYLLNGYGIGLLRDYTVKYRMHDSNLSNNKGLLSQKMIKVLQKYTLDNIYSNLKSKFFKEKEIYVTLGIIELIKREYQSGFELLKKADGMKADDKRVEFENKFYLGVAGYKLNDLWSSYRDFSRAYELDRSEPTILNNYGVLNLVLESDIALGRHLINKSFAIKPNYIDAKINCESIKKKDNHYKITERILETNYVVRKQYNI